MQGLQQRRPRCRVGNGNRFRRRRRKLQGGGDVGQLRDHAPADIAVVGPHGLVAQEVALDLRPALRLRVVQHAAQLGQLQQVFFGAGGQQLCLAQVVVGDQLLQLVLVHHRRDLLGQLVHVAVATLQPERRLGAVAIVLRGTGDVLLVDAVDHVAHAQHALQGGGDFVDLRAAVGVAEAVGRDLLAHRPVDQRVQVSHVARSQRRQHRVGSQAVLDVAEGKGRLHATEHITQVVDVGTVGQHVRNLEHLAGLGIRVAGHHHAEFLAAHVVGAGATAPHTFDTAGAIAQRDELLQELRMGVLDVVHIQHGVVAHFQRQVELLQLLPRGRVRCLGRVQRPHLVTQRRAVDLHEDQAQAVRHVFHQRGLAVAGRRNHHQQAHQVAALVLADRAHLLGQVVTDHAQVDIIDQLVAYERGQRPRLELGKPQGLALAADDALAQRLVGMERWHEMTQVLLQAHQEVIQRYHQRAVADACVFTQQATDLRLQRGVAGTGTQLALHQQQCCSLVDVAGMRGMRRHPRQRPQPLTGQRPARGQRILAALQGAFDRLALPGLFQLPSQCLQQRYGMAAAAEHRFAGR